MTPEERTIYTELMREFRRKLQQRMREAIEANKDYFKAEAHRIAEEEARERAKVEALKNQHGDLIGSMIYLQEARKA